MDIIEKIFWIIIGVALALITLSITAVVVYGAAHLIITGRHL